jgi:hypothetical protein
MGMTDVSIIIPDSKEIFRSLEPTPENEFESSSVNMIKLKMTPRKTTDERLLNCLTGTDPEMMV